MPVHVFGDSHSKIYQGLRTDLRLHYMGPVTMHRVGRDGLRALNFRTAGVKNNDHVICVFGEIDVRCHLGKQRDLKQREEKEILQTLATQYVRTLQANIQQYPKVVVWVRFVTPPLEQCMNADYPVYGSLEDRVHLTVSLNGLLKSLCEGLLKYMDGYEQFIDDKGQINRNLSDGNVHLGPRAAPLVQQQLNRYIRKPH